MKASLRPTCRDDFEALRVFLARAFDAAPGAPFLDPAVMSWKYWDRRDDWTGPRAYLMEKEGAIVAHAAIWPMVIGAGPDAIRGIQMIDWASAKESPGTGLALVQKLAGMHDFMYSIGGSEMTRKALPAFGFAEYASGWKAASPLRPVRQILTHQHKNWKLAPRLVRNLLWATSSATRPEGWRAEEIAPDRIPTEIYDGFAPRPPAFFEYLLRCPVASFRLYRIMDARGLQGHFAISLLRGQARVAGVWLRDPANEGWQKAYALTRQTAKRLDGAFEIVATGTGEKSAGGAAHAGFRIMEGPPVYLLNKTGRLALPRDFQFQLSDDDGAFLDTGTSYWT